MIEQEWHIKFGVAISPSFVQGTTCDLRTELPCWTLSYPAVQSRCSTFPDPDIAHLQSSSDQVPTAYLPRMDAYCVCMTMYAV